jgi:hypothetical protein
MNWMMGLEAKAVAAPMEFAPAIAAGSPVRLRLVKSANGSITAARKKRVSKARAR